MSKLSDLWRGIQSGFDINKMKRDPLGSIGKIAAIYGIGASAYGLYDPAGAQRTANWMKGGFGLYNTGPTGAPRAPSGKYGPGVNNSRAAYGSFSPPPKSSPSTSKYGGFLERQIKGIGDVVSKPFDLGSDVRKWMRGDIDWNTVKKNNFGFIDSKMAGQAANFLMEGRGGGGGGNPRPKKKIEYRDFRGNVGAPISANISNLSAGKSAVFAQGGISQALITGGITAESLKRLGYGAGGVTARPQTIALGDKNSIKTTLTSAIG